MLTTRRDTMIVHSLAGSPERSRGRSEKRKYFQALEVLEPRLLLTTESPGLVIAGVAAVDLVPAFGSTTKIPASIITNKPAHGNVKLIVTNSSGSSDTIASPLKIDVDVVARPVGAVDSSQDVVLSKPTATMSVGGLAPGKSRSIALPITFPSTLAAGQYDIIAMVDTTNVLAETNEDNNSVTSDTVVTAAPPFMDPALSFNHATVFPSSVVADGGTLPIKINLTNLGNVRTTAGTGTITITAHNLSTGTDTTLDTISNVSLTGLAPSGTRTLTLSPVVPADLDNGQYAVDVALTDSLAGDVTSNNTAVSTDIGQTLVVAPASFDVAASIGSRTLPPAIVTGTTPSDVVNVTVTNDGNTTLPAVQLTDVSVALRPVGAVDSSQDIIIGNVTSRPLNKLAVGASRTIAVPVHLVGTIPSGNYDLVATVTPTNLTETSTDNNVVVDNDALTVSTSFNDIGIVIATTSFGGSNAGGGATGTGTVTLENFGNIHTKGNVALQFFASTTDNIVDGQLIGAGLVPINLNPGQTITSTAALTLPAQFTSSTLTLFAKIVPSGFTDTNPDNDVAQAGTLTTSGTFIDLSLSNATIPFGATAIGGASGSATANVANLGNETASGAVTISFFESQSTTFNAGTAVQIGTTSTNINLNPGDVSMAIAVPVTLSAPGVSSTFTIFAEVTSNALVDSNPANNLLTVGSLTVNP